MPSATDQLLQGVLESVAGVPIRKPYPSERAFFKKNLKVGGMAAKDNKIVLNPFSGLSRQEQEAVAVNEAARVRMRTNKQLKPSFKLTKKQARNLKGTIYENASPTDRRSTIAARLLSGDPSGGQPTPEQQTFVQKLSNVMFPKKTIGEILDE